jgi:hypothetical protein
VAQECAPIGEMSELTEEGELAGIVERQQPGEEQAAEQGAQHAHRQEESRTGGYPSVPIRRDTAARHDHVDVRVMTLRYAHLAPEHRREAVEVLDKPRPHLKIVATN